MVFPRSIGIELEAELLFPFERVTCARQRIVAIACAFTTACNIGCVCGDLVCDHAFANVVRIWKTEMFFRRDVAERVRSVPADEWSPTAFSLTSSRAGLAQETARSTLPL